MHTGFHPVLAIAKCGHPLSNMVDLKLKKLPTELANGVSHDVFLWPKFNIIVLLYILYYSI